MYHFDYVSVGIDVGSDFSWVTILLPNYRKAVKTFKILHDDVESLEEAASKIRKAEEMAQIKSKLFLESTGIYHIPLFHYFQDRGFETAILNPLVLNSSKNSDIRKVKNDKKDSENIARIGYTYDLKTSLVPDDLVISLRTIIRQYYSFKKDRTSYVNRLHKELRVAFPKYCKVFSDVSGKTSLAVLRKYDSPKQILSAPKEELVDLIRLHSKAGLRYSEEKAEKVIEAAKTSEVFGKVFVTSFIAIRNIIAFIDKFDETISEIKASIDEILKEYAENKLVKQIELIKSIKGIGEISAISLMCEIGDFSGFLKPKKLCAFFGIDPSVKESGKFKGTKVKISKRGSRLARRILYSIALNMVRVSKNGVAVNQVIKEFYEKKTQSKAKKVALVAVMRKITNIIFAVLRDEKPYKMRTPEEHCKNYKIEELVQAA